MNAGYNQSLVAAAVLIVSRYMTTRQQQFVEAYSEYSDDLFRYCFFKLNDREQAKDLVQDAFMRAWNYLERGTDVGNIRAFLYKILANLVIDEYRKRKPSDSLETLHETGFDPSFDDTDRWVDIIDGAQAVDLIRQIPHPYGEAVFMRYVQELSLGEIAEIMHESENTIAVRIHRGMNKLRDLFNQNGKTVTRQKQHA